MQWRILGLGLGSPAQAQLLLLLLSSVLRRFGSTTKLTIKGNLFNFIVLKEILGTHIIMHIHFHIITNAMQILFEL